MAVKQMMTADELWELPDVPGKRFELVDGEVTELTGAGDRHMAIVESVYKLLDRFVEEYDLGLVRPDGLSYVLKREPDTVRVPDTSFVSWDVVPEGDASDGFWEGAPTLAIEVVSPNDRASDIQERVQDYLEAGSRQVWVLWPRRRVLSVHTPDRQARELGPETVLSGGDILPGFSVTVGDLFETQRRRR